MMKLKPSMTVCCLITSLCFSIPAALAQVGTIHNVGTTVTNLDAIAFASNGTLYGATGGGEAGALYTINPSTGAATLIHALVGVSNPALTYGVTGLAFQPGTGTLYGSTGNTGTSSPHSVVTINPATGQVTVIGSSGAGPYPDITFTSDGTLYGWLVGSGTDSLATINLSTGLGTSLGSPQSNATTKGDGLAASASNVIYSAAPGVGNAFWTLSRVNGAPTVIGTLSGGPGLSDAISALAFSPSGVLYGVNGGDDGDGWNLVTIDIAAPAVPSVPTLSEWSLGLLAIALMGAAVALLARRQNQSAA